MEKLEDRLKRMRQTKTFALKNLGKYKKAVPITRPRDIWFNESKFTIRYDLNSLPIFPGIDLCVGDVCKFDYDFYVELISVKQGCGYRRDWNAKVCHKEISPEDRYVLVAFVEMNSPRHRGIFCVLDLIPDDLEFMFHGIAESLDGSLLLFYPEGLKIVNPK